MRCSMSRKGECCDNAPMERFFGSLKTELDGDGPFETKQAARSVLSGFIEGFDNRNASTPRSVTSRQPTSNYSPRPRRPELVSTSMGHGQTELAGPATYRKR